MGKRFVVEVKGFGKHVIEKVEANDRDEAAAKVIAKYGISVTSVPAT